MQLTFEYYPNNLYQIKMTIRSVAYIFFCYWQQSDLLIHLVLDTYARSSVEPLSKLRSLVGNYVNII